MKINYRDKKTTGGMVHMKINYCDKKTTGGMVHMKINHCDNNYNLTVMTQV